jgi:hypothetical protein
MLATFDVTAVRHFTEELNERLRVCDTGEGMVCSTLDDSITFHVKLCEEFWTGINQWARAVFTGKIKLDLDVEEIFKSEAQKLLEHAKPVAARGRAMNWQCYELAGLNALHFHIVGLDYLLENWVSPKSAVGPAPRVQLTDATTDQVIQHLARLAPLPSDWHPTDPEQLAVFQKHRDALTAGEPR